MVTNRVPLALLIERLKQPTERDRELDAAIYIALRLPANRIGRIDQNGGVVGWWPKDAPYVSAVASPHYTGNLEAAMSTLPPGWFLGGLSFCPPGDSRQRVGSRVAQAVLWNGKHGDEHKYVWGESFLTDDHLSDMCRALVAAGLRARMEDMGDGQH